jgi:hypothetical protein
MISIDLHGKPLVVAIREVVKCHNGEARYRRQAVIRVIHGYGSSGVGGVIRHALRAYLMAHGVEYQTGEYVERNPGVTLIYTKREPIEDPLMTRWGRGLPSAEENVRLFSDLRARFEKLMEEREAERKKLAELVDESRRDRDAFASRLREREGELKHNAAQTDELEAKAAALEKERQELQRSRDEVEARHKAALAAAEQASVEDHERATAELARRMEALDQKGQELDSQRSELLLFRKQLLWVREEVSAEKNRAEQDLRRRTEELNQFAARASQIEEENARLKKELENSEKRPLNPQGLRRRWTMWVLGSTCALFLFCLLPAALLQRGCSGPAPDPGQASPSKTADKAPDKLPTDVTKNAGPKEPRAISPGDAGKWEGKEATVEFTIGSTYDGFDWALMINSEEDFKNPKNFRVVIERKTAGEEYSKEGIKDLVDYFRKGKSVRATGKVEKYTDKKTGRESYEIRVNDSKQVVCR